MKIKSKVSIIDHRDHEENTEDKTINNENPEDQNEDENLDHEEHTEDDLAPRNETNLTPVTVFSQTQPSQNLWYSN